MYAINSTDGSQKWAFTTKGSVNSSPAIDKDGVIYVGSKDNNLYALNPTDGSLKWSFPTTGEVISSPANGWDGSVYVGSGDGKLYAIGKQLPTVSLSGSNLTIEGTVTTTITATLSFTHTQAITVTLATIDGTANANLDYLPITTPLIFNPGQTQANYTLIIKDDDLIEPNEVFTVTMMTQNAWRTPTPDNEVTITIQDNDGPVDTKFYMPLIIKHES